MSSRFGGLKHGWQAKLLLVASMVLVGFGVVEVMLRVAGISYPIMTRNDEFRGGAHRPGAHGWYSGESRVYVQINSQGLRDDEHAVTKPPGTFRIAVLGDSYAEALQVPVENTFWSVMERKLSECPGMAGRDVEAINFGVSGYGTAQELITLRRHAWDYQPDLILLAFTTGNDVRNNSRALDGAFVRPYFVYQNDELVLDDSFRNSAGFRLRRSWLAEAWYGLLDRSNAFQLINEAKTRWALAMPQPAAPSAAEAAPSGYWSEPGLDDQIYKPPQSPEWEDAWRVTEGIILMMDREVKAKGANFLVVSLTNGIQVHPDRSVRANFMQRLEVDDLMYPERRIREFSERHGIGVLTLADRLLPHAEADQIFFHGYPGRLGYGHWNGRGHQLAGEAIAEHICSADAGSKQRR